MKNYVLIFREKAIVDLEEIEFYYDQISAKITNQFFAELRDSLNIIEHEPYLFQVRYKQIKIAPMQKFPYGIHYKILNDKISILRVLHFKRFYKR
ncbi:MAG: hypothetical protein EOP42_19205 [Sphingobacteriaceae bacterium]|nr:MAG: hypothetical protein EOP42_19205 [Sphingobacteriaceae bacterium]